MNKLSFSLYIWGATSVEKSTGISTLQDLKKTSYAILLTKMYLVHVAIVPGLLRSQARSSRGFW